MPFPTGRRRASTTERRPTISSASALNMLRSVRSKVPNPKKVVPKVVRRRHASSDGRPHASPGPGEGRPAGAGGVSVSGGDGTGAGVGHGSGSGSGSAPGPGPGPAIGSTTKTGSGARIGTNLAAVEVSELARAAEGASETPRKSGMLVKYTNAFKGWKPRLFTLETGILTYVAAAGPGAEDEEEHGLSNPVRQTSAAAMNGNGELSKKKRIKHKIGLGHDVKEKEKDVRGAIEVQFAVITADDTDATRFAIDTGNEFYHFKAATRKERDDWVRVLNASKAYFSSLVERAALRSSRSIGVDGSTQPLSSPTGDWNEPRDGTARVPAPVRGRSASSVSPSSPSEAEQRNASPSSLTCGAGVEVFRKPSEEARGDAQAPPSPSGGQAIPSPSTGLRHLPSTSTVDTQLEDDGVAEAAAARRALVTELRRVCSVVVPGEPSSLEAVFDDDDPATGVRDLAVWALHVLKTDSVLIDRRVSAGVARAMRRRRTVSAGAFNDDDGGEACVFGEDSDDDDFDESEFFDARSRTGSDRNSVSRVADVPEIGDFEDMVDPLDSPESGDERRTLVRVDTSRLVTMSGRAPRMTLPPLESPPPKLNIWGILKDAVGKDLSKISIPVGLNEPISFLQRLAEDIEYSELLDQAAAEPDQHRRMMLVATMVISHYSSTQNRIGKPFNPLLGETFSFVMPNKGNGVRYVAEQVSHHPPVSACYAEGSRTAWKYYNSIEVKNKFWGKSLEVFPTGCNHVEIPAYGDHFEFEQVTACVHNIFLGASKMWLDNYGDMEIVNKTTGDRCIVKFQKSGWMSDAKSLGAVSGVVYDSSGSAKVKFSGRWTDAVYEELPRRQRKLIWQVRRRPPLRASNNYNMTQWAIALNQEVSEEDRGRTAPTDSTLRPDQRALEAGKYELAGKLKAALEEGQRERRSARERAGVAWNPLWFTKSTNAGTGRTEYLYNGRYFQAELSGAWDNCEDLFSCATALRES